LNGPDAQANAFIQYRLGQCELRLGNEKAGIDRLLRAYMLSGDDIFSAEPDGREYLKLLKDRGLV
jgi:hypothetical protein